MHKHAYFTRTPMPFTLSHTLIRHGTAADLSTLGYGNYSFEVSATLVEPFSTHHSVAVPVPYRKNYGFDADELARYIAQPDKALLVAQRQHSLAGYLAIASDWNRYGLITDIALDVAHRGSDAAALLMDAALAWAKQTKLAGLRLETQSTNIAACRFYEKYGFVLGGYDRFLYQGLHSGTPEVALFWYLHC